MVRCKFKECTKTAKSPREEGWSFLGDWGPRVPNGYYCRAHADALEALAISGELDELQKQRE